MATPIVYSGRNPVRNASGSSASLPRPVDIKLRSFGRRVGRNAAAPQTLGRAELWLRAMREAGFADLDVFLGAIGEVLVSGIQGDFCFEVTVEVDGTLSVAFEQDNQQVYYLSRQSEYAALQRLVEAASNIWTSSGGFMRINSTAASPASQVSRSGILPVQTTACPWLNHYVA